MREGRDRSGREQRLLFFTHVHKAGGTTVEAIMRRNLGLRHMVVSPRIGWLYDLRDLRADRRLNPFAYSFAGHWLRPFADFGPSSDAIVWYTMLRDPVSRYVSHWRYHVEKMGVETPFEAWLDDPIQHDLQTWLLCGERNLDRAREVLAERYRVVGLLERFEESLLLFRERLHLRDLTVAYDRPRNVAPTGSDAALRAAEAAEIYRQRIVENNRLDLELYRFAAEELFPRHIEAYGGERLRRDLEQAFSEPLDRRHSAARLRDRSAAAFQRAVYLPAHRIRHVLARRRGEPDRRM